MPLPKEVHERRRRRFMQAIGEDAIAILPAASEAIRSNDTEYRFRQNSDFHYLTGFPEPDAVCVLRPGHETEEYVLFVRPRDPERETWTGLRAGVEGAVERYGASAAHPLDEMEKLLPGYVNERDRLFYSFGPNHAFNQRVIEWYRRGYANRLRHGKGPAGISEPREILNDMRLFKEPEELELLRRAIAISAEAHVQVMRTARPGMAEYEIEAMIDHHFRRSGAAAPAYATIVASGRNATILHYTGNESHLADGELLLVDAGAEYDFYCGDITRTIPVDARFTGRRRELYDLVLQAQLAAVEMVRPGVRVDEVHGRALEILVDGLLQLKLLEGERAQIIEKEEFKPFCMHRTSHWLGVDVHDAGAYKPGGQSRLLEPGMVLTVEPGLYLGEHLDRIPVEWRGIGVRIEDDVLVTPSGHEVLSAAAPKAIDAIERLRAEAFA